MKVYIAGPMRGINEFNFPAFHQAAQDLEYLYGHDVVNPAQHDVDNGFDPSNMTGHEDLAALGFDLREALAWDMEQITKCDALFLLKGWEKSSGARAEYALARALGLALGSEEQWESKIGWYDDGDEFAKHWGLHHELLATTKPAAPSFTTTDSGEVRITSSTGGQKGSKPERYDLIPVLPLRELALLYGFGATKYDDDNWKKGYDFRLSFAALNRHLWAWWGGEETDSESQVSHLASVAWHAFALMHFSFHPGQYGQFDNRPKEED